LDTNYVNGTIFLWLYSVTK